MPIVDSIDIPALARCSLMEAILWIERGRVPVKMEYEEIVHGDSGRIPNNPDEFLKSVSKLYALLSAEGGVPLYGRPAIGFRKKIVHEPKDNAYTPSPVEIDYWGDEELITREKVNESGLNGIREAIKTLHLFDGALYPTPEMPETAWVYSDIRVDFECLKNLCPRGEASDIRVGDEIRIAQKRKTEEKRGRKEIYSTEGLLALMAAVLEFKGEFESESAAIRCLQEAHRGIYKKEKEENGEKYKEPSRPTIQEKIMKRINHHKKLYKKYIEELDKN